jgi:hypothetical protein
VRAAASAASDAYCASVVLGGAQAAVPAAGRQRQPQPVLARAVPAVERRRGLRRVGADVGDLDADRAHVRLPRVPGLLARVEGLVDRAVEVEQEVHRQPALLVQRPEAGAAGPGHVVVQHEEVHHPPQVVQLEHALALRGRERGVGDLASRVVRQAVRARAIRAVERRLEPAHDRRVDREALPADDDLAARRGRRLGLRRDRAAPGREDRQQRR